jgi:hypothetical protein
MPQDPIEMLNSVVYIYNTLIIIFSKFSELRASLLARLLVSTARIFSSIAQSYRCITVSQ